MLAVTTISPSFQLQPKVSCNKFAQQKTEKLFKVTKDFSSKALKKNNIPTMQEAFFSNLQTITPVACVTKQAPNVYATTSEKLNQQKGARLFQEI